MKKKALLLLLISSINLGLQSQVTIGSALKPNKGSLLDLKEFESPEPGGANSTKGILLPRVALEAKDISEPIFPSGSAGHEGLMVYNTSQQQRDACDFTASVLKAGIYVWSGNKWIDVSNPNDPNESEDILNIVVRSPAVKTFVDNRDPNKPETYAYRQFGDAGFWMTTNLRATRFSENALGISWGYDLKEGGYNTSKLPIGFYYGTPYPYYKDEGGVINTSIVNKGFDPYWVKENPLAGYVYNYSTIIRGNSDANGHRQGICPDGWHVPTLAEYQKLLVEIFKDPKEYLIPDENKEYNYEVSYKNALVVNCTPYASWQPSTWHQPPITGKSRSYSDGGFGDFGLGVIFLKAQVSGITKNAHSLIYDNIVSRNEFGSQKNFPRYIHFDLTSEKEDAVLVWENEVEAFNVRCVMN